MNCAAAKFVPRSPSLDHKEEHLQLLGRFFSSIRWSRVITGDESWIYGYDILRQSSPSWQMKNQQEDCIIVILPTKLKVNSTFYCDVLRRLREKVRNRRPKIWEQGCYVVAMRPIILLCSPRNFWPKTTWLLSHLSYSPDSALYDWVLFSKLKIKLIDREYDMIEMIKQDKLSVLSIIRERDFQDAFGKWQHPYDWCLRAEG